MKRAGAILVLAAACLMTCGGLMPAQAEEVPIDVSSFQYLPTEFTSADWTHITVPEEWCFQLIDPAMHGDGWMAASPRIREEYYKLLEIVNIPELKDMPTELSTAAMPHYDSPRAQVAYALKMWGRAFQSSERPGATQKEKDRRCQLAASAFRDTVSRFPADRRIASYAQLGLALTAGSGPSYWSAAELEKVSDFKEFPATCMCAEWYRARLERRKSLHNGMERMKAIVSRYRELQDYNIYLDARAVATSGFSFFYDFIPPK